MAKHNGEAGGRDHKNAPGRIRLRGGLAVGGLEAPLAQELIGLHEVIHVDADIGQELFDKVAERLAENKSMPARSRAKAEYLLTGKLYCGYCKEKMVGHSSNQISRKGVIFNYYKCKNAGGGKPCHKKMAQKDKLEGIVIDECRKLLTASNIKKISKEIMKISRSLDDQSEIKRLTRVIDQLTHQRENQVRATRQCTDDALRLLFFEDMKVITEEIEAAHRQLELEKTRHRVMTEEEVTAFLQKLAKGNVNNFQYRKALIKTFVNKVFLYDDRFTIVFNTGADPVTITDQLLETIESAGETPALCFSDDEAHQTQIIRTGSSSRKTGSDYLFSSSSSRKRTSPTGNRNFRTRSPEALEKDRPSDPDNPPRSGGSGLCK